MSLNVSIQAGFEKHTFCSTGDLWLEIGERKARCLVSSSKMAAASPTFKAMLFSGYSESQPTDGEWLVRLPEDAIEGFYPILKMAHGDWKGIPTFFRELEHRPGPIPWGYLRDTLQYMYQVARVADKYMFTHVLQRIIRPWSRAIDSMTPHYDRVEGSSVAVLWIGWVFGNGFMIETELRNIYLRAYVIDQVNEKAGAEESDWEEELRLGDEESKFLPLWTPRLFASGSPQDAYRILDQLDISILEQLKSKRLAMLAKILTRIRNLIHSETPYPFHSLKGRYMSCGNTCIWHQTSCDMLLKDVFCVEDGNLPQPETIKSSVKDLVYELRSFQKRIASDKRLSEMPTCHMHQWIFNTMIASVGTILDLAPMPSIGIPQERHLERQRAALAKRK